MTKKSFNIIALILGSILFLSVLYFIVGVVGDKKSGPDNASYIFDNLSEKTSDLALRYDVNSQTFAKKFLSAIGDIDDFSFIQLFYASNLIYSYPDKNSSAVEMTDTEFIKNFTKELKLSSGATLTLKAGVYTVKPSSIFYHARTAFVLILIVTLTAILILIFAKTNAESNEKTDAKIIFEDITPTSFSSNDVKATTTFDSNEDEEFPSQSEVEFSKKTETAESEKDTPPVKNTEVEQTQISRTEEESIWEESSLPLNETKSEDTISIIDETSPFDDDKSKDEIKLKEESTLVATLEEELVNAASSEQDLSLFIIRAAELSRTQSEEFGIDKLLLTTVEERGFAFTYGQDSYALLLKNMKLDDALVEAEKLLESVLQALHENEHTNFVSIGISSRTERLISAGRLLTEAAEAQKHAAEDPSSPIIAFRVNPEKYRNFILNN